MSVYIQWRDDFSVNNEELDNQHKKLIETLANLLEAMWAGRGREELRNVIDFLTSYVQEHFHAEELYMAQIGYPGLDTHKQIHINFMNNVKKFREELLNGNVTSDTAINVFFDTWDWLKKHILKEDKMYAEYYKSKVSTEI